MKKSSNDMFGTFCATYTANDNLCLAYRFDFG